MKTPLISLIIALLVIPSIVAAHEPNLDNPELAPVKSFLEQKKLLLTTSAADAQKTGYILALGSGKGSRLAAQRAATVVAQRNIAAIMADMPGKKKKPTKQVTQSSRQTQTAVSGKVKGAVTIFKQYDTSQQTMYLVMRKEIP